MPASGYEILKSAKLCAKIAKWVSANVDVLGVLGVLAVQRLLTRQKDLPDSKYLKRRLGRGWRKLS